MMTAFLWMTMTVSLLLLSLTYIFFAFYRGFSVLPVLSLHDRLYAFSATVLCAAPVFLFGKWGRTWMVALLHVCAFLILSQLLDFVLKRMGLSLSIWQILYRFSVIPILLTAVIMTWGYFNMTHIIRTEYTLRTDKAIPAEGITIALVADTHFGNATTFPFIRDMMERIASERPDILLLGGDIVDENTTKEEMETLFPLLGSFRAPLGTYYVYGNHDRQNYSATPYFTERELETAIKNSGISILADDTVSLSDHLILAGRRDRTMGQCPVSELLKTTSPAAYRIVLDHQPYDFAAKEMAGADLTLSGHTHAGQIFPAGFFTAGDLNYGFKALSTMTAVVTSGASGWGFPIRTSKHSEYVLVHILPS